MAWPDRTPTNFKGLALASQPFSDFFLILAVNESKHEQHNSQCHKAQDAVDSFKLPDIEEDNSAERKGEHAQADPAVHSFPQEQSHPEKDQSQQRPARGKIKSAGHLHHPTRNKQPEAQRSDDYHRIMDGGVEQITIGEATSKLALGEQDEDHLWTARPKASKRAKGP